MSCIVADVITVFKDTGGGLQDAALLLQPNHRFRVASVSINLPSDTLKTGRVTGDEPTRRSEVSPASEQEGVDMHLTSGVREKKPSPRDENPTQ